MPLLKKTFITTFQEKHMSECKIILRSSPHGESANECIIWTIATDKVLCEHVFQDFKIFPWFEIKSIPFKGTKSNGNFYQLIWK